jgi:broad specificity phosphatase PhoE
MARCLGHQHPDGHVLVFTHAGVVNQIAAGSIAGQSAARWDNYRPNHAAITEVLFNGPGFGLARFDDSEHLSLASSYPLA